MPSSLGRAIRLYVKGVDSLNEAVGTFAMYLFIVMLGILSYAVYTNVVVDRPVIWVMEMAQFTMAAYYTLGGGYTLKEGAHVRMDVLYDRWSPRTKAIVDSVTGLILLFYLGLLVFGGFTSTQYALEYGQKNYSAWGPPMAPIKIIITTGMTLMLLQASAFFLRDVCKAMGKKIE